MGRLSRVASPKVSASHSNSGNRVVREVSRASAAQSNIAPKPIRVGMDGAIPVQWGEGLRPEAFWRTGAQPRNQSLRTMAQIGARRNTLHPTMTIPRIDPA